MPAVAAEAGRVTRNVGFELKSIRAVEPTDTDPGGWDVRGYFSVFNNVDLDGDVIRRGAFANALAADLPKVKDHHGVTVGQATAAVEDDHGLLADVRIYPTTAGRDVAILMQAIDTTHGKRAPVEQGSIGYRPTPNGAKRLPNGTRELTELMLFEVSPVTHGANPLTRIGLVKGLDVGGYDGKVSELLSDVSRAVLAAVTEAKALSMRRAASGRDIGPDNMDAMAELALVAGDAMVQLVGLEAKAGRGSVSARRREYLAGVLRALGQFVESLPDGERAEVEALLTGESGNADGGAGDAKASGGDAGASTKDAPDAGTGEESLANYRAELEAKLLRHKLAEYSE